MDIATEQWKRDGTGPWAKFSCECCIGLFKLDELTKMKEFQDLPADEQEYLKKETTPHYKLLAHLPMHWFTPTSPLGAVKMGKAGDSDTAADATVDSSYRLMGMDGLRVEDMSVIPVPIGGHTRRQRML
ncbi:hypothetical protein GX48_07846 [Paracoccidioides brasiliensis]|nr:hypothetical protein GX48_07846 [Paracoccidioides brasiliensis]